jgi:CelD/BcsL family acetyltransferase involved in cellulose biosynthesis
MRREADAARAPLVVERVDGAAGFAALRSEWEALVDRGRASPFSRWAWLYPWWRRLHPERTPWVLVARDAEGAVRGLMPLSLDRTHTGGVAARRLAWLGEDAVGSDYLDVVCAPGDEASVGGRFGEWLARAHALWDVLELKDVEVNAPGAAAVVEALRATHGVSREPRFTCPGRTFVPGESFDLFLRRTARRDNFLRRRRWLEKQGGFAVEVAHAPGELTGPLGSFFHLHARRWASDGGSQGIRGPRVEGFHRDATRLLAESGLLRLYTLKVGGEAVASVYGILDRSTFHYYQGGYAPEWAARSVGLVLVGETFRDAMEAGCTRYDFLRGTEPYKADWVDAARQTESIRVLAPTLAARAWATSQEARRAGRGLVKSLLPARVKEAIQRKRRQAAVR